MIEFLIMLVIGVISVVFLFGLYAVNFLHSLNKMDEEVINMMPWSEEKKQQYLLETKKINYDIVFGKHSIL